MPPKLSLIRVVDITCRMRPPNLIACEPCCFAVKLLSSQKSRLVDGVAHLRTTGVERTVDVQRGHELLPICSLRRAVLKASFVNRRGVQNRGFG